MSETTETSAGEAGDWYDDAPITDEQIEAIRVGFGDGTDGPVYYQFLRAVVCKLLAEIDRLNTVLDANRVVRNAAESSSRVYKAVTERLKSERTCLRVKLNRCAGLNRDLVNEAADATERAVKAEAEVERLRKAGHDLAQHDLASMTRATAAEDALAELRERIGGAEIEWGHQVRYDAGWVGDVVPQGGETTARLAVDHMNTRVLNASARAVLVVHEVWHAETEWRVADDAS